MNYNQPNEPVNQPGQQPQWVPVDPATLGFELNAKTNEPFVGPDGHTYRVGGEPQYGGVMNQMQNAIPTPSSIVQMPPIVQPIALVPYTSQNQPLLQYDPYSRPVDPQVAPPKPVYVKEAYRKLSLAAVILSLVGFLIGLVFATAAFKETLSYEAFSVSGIGAIQALLAAAGLEVNSPYYTNRIGNIAEGETMALIVAYAIPVLIVLVMLFFVGLAIKYIVRYASKKTPRSFSVAALLNVLFLGALVGLLIAMNKSVAEEEAISDFFLLRSTVAMTAALIINFVLSLVLFILPFFAKKNKYTLADSDDGTRYHIDATR